MNIELFSKKYKVQKLSESDTADILDLCAGNPLYYKYCPPFVTKETIANDLKALPPQKTLNDKYYIGYYDNNRLIAIMDLINHFPDDETALIGLFMMHNSEQGKGIGSSIITELTDYLPNEGIKRLRLGWSKENKQSKYFWRKNHFEETGTIADLGEYLVVIAQREL